MPLVNNLIRGGLCLRDMGASRERPRVQQAFGRSLAEEESLSFSARAGVRVVEECSLRNICGLRRKAAAKAARLDPEYLPAVTTTNARLVTSPMASAAIRRQDGGRRLPARAQLAEGCLVSVLPIGVNRTRNVRGLIALPGHLLSIAVFQEIIRDSLESAGRRSAGNVG